MPMYVTKERDNNMRDRRSIGISYDVMYLYQYKYKHKHIPLYATQIVHLGYALYCTLNPDRIGNQERGVGENKYV